METLTLPQEDMHDETLAAFLGALDDIAASTPDATELASPDAEIAGRVMGLFDIASTFYDADMARNMELVGSLASRLGEMACAGHSHMESVLESVSEKYGQQQDDHDHYHDGHGADHGKHKAKKKKTKSKKDKKKLKMTDRFILAKKPADKVLQ